MHVGLEFIMFLYCFMLLCVAFCKVAKQALDIFCFTLPFFPILALHFFKIIRILSPIFLLEATFHVVVVQ